MTKPSIFKWKSLLCLSAFDDQNLSALQRQKRVLNKGVWKYRSSSIVWTAIDNALNNVILRLNHWFGYSNKIEEEVLPQLHNTLSDINDNCQKLILRIFEEGFAVCGLKRTSKYWSQFQTPNGQYQDSWLFRRGTAARLWGSSSCGQPPGPSNWLERTMEAINIIKTDCKMCSIGRKREKRHEPRVFWLVKRRKNRLKTCCNFLFHCIWGEQLALFLACHSNEDYSGISFVHGSAPASEMNCSSPNPTDLRRYRYIL